MKRLFFIALAVFAAFAAYKGGAAYKGEMPAKGAQKVAAPAAETAPMQLLMLERAGCPWCERWHDEIGPIYPKTAEGKAAPLRVVRVDRDLPADLKSLRKGHFTPTFVLWSGGQELGRLRGYQSEDFFWALIGEMIADARAGEAPGTVN